MATRELTDDEVFGGRELSDDEVFGASRADPKIGQPEELTFAERTLAPILERLGFGASTKGGAVGRILRGAADPTVAAAQLAANALPGGVGAKVNEWVKGQENDYQAARAIEGSEGFDPLRAVGSAIATAPLGAAGAGVVRGAAVGAASGALDPVRDAGDSFWGQKGGQVATGAVGGAVMSPILGALARVVSPKASTDAGVKALQDAGVKPTVGQTLGGMFNTIEQQATSIPIMGPAIGAARRRSFEDFNRAGLDKAAEQVGGKVTAAGHEGLKQARTVIGGAYDDAADGLGHANLVGTTFDKNFGELQAMVTEGLPLHLATRFERVLSRDVLGRLSANGSVAGSEVKKIESALGKEAAKFRGSQDTWEREYGDAVRQLLQNFRDGIAEVDPVYAAKKSAADRGYAMLVRAREATKGVNNAEGIYTPQQYNAAVRRSDKTLNKRAFTEGDALMQDFAKAGLRLGNTVPDSGTAGRVLNIAAGVATGGAHLGVPVALTAGAAMYHPAIQNILREMIVRRPDMAPRVANYLRQLSASAAVGGVALQQEMD